MKTKLTSHSKYLRKLYIASLSAAMLTVQVRHAGAQTDQDMIEVARSVVAADRKAVVVAAMQLTEKEGTSFWPLYDDYRKEGHFEMSAKVDAIAAAEGAALNAKYREGVLIFTLPRSGLMAQAAIGGQKFSYKPLQ